MDAGVEPYRDNIHPNAAGQRLTAAAIAAIIAERPEAKPQALNPEKSSHKLAGRGTGAGAVCNVRENEVFAAVEDAGGSDCQLASVWVKIIADK